MPKINNIAKNTSFFTAALILQKIISFTYFTILARNLAPAELGKYYLAISFTTIFAIFIDLGLSNVLVREVAKYKDRAGRLLGSVISIKLPLALITILAVFALANLLDYPEITRHLIYLSSISMILDSFTLAFFSTIRGFHNLKYESIAAVIFQLIVLSLGFIAVKAGLNLRFVISALVLASIFNFVFSYCVFKFKLKVKIKLIFKYAKLKPLILITVPFAMFAVFQRMYMYLDTVMLSKLADDYYVGLYQIAFKIIFALQFLPMAFIASAYPAFSDYWKNDRKQLSITFERAINYLVIISLPISIGIITLADKIILIFKPEYAGAALPLRIILASLLFIFLNFPIGALLNACDKQKINTMNMGIALAASIILNLILIPKFQASGAAITVILTNLLMLILGIYWVPKIININRTRIFKIFLKVVLSAFAMGIFALSTKSSLNIFAVIFLSGLFYFCFLLVSRTIEKEDIASIIQSFKKPA